MSLLLWQFYYQPINNIDEFREKICKFSKFCIFDVKYFIKIEKFTFKNTKFQIGRYLVWKLKSSYHVISSYRVNVASPGALRFWHAFFSPLSSRELESTTPESLRDRLQILELEVPPAFCDFRPSPWSSGHVGILLVPTKTIMQYASPILGPAYVFGRPSPRAHYSCALTSYVSDIAQQDYLRSLGRPLSGGPAAAVPASLRRPLRTYQGAETISQFFSVMRSNREMIVANIFPLENHRS